MPKNQHIYTNFTAGELSPRLAGRIDVDKYQNGCKEVTNFITTPHGTAQRRGGFRYIAEAKDSTNNVRLISFEFNTSQTYILELGHNYMRFYADEGVVVSSGTTPYEITTPWTGAQVMSIQFAQSADVMYLVHPDVAPRKLSRTGHTNWSLTTPTFSGDHGSSAWTTNYPRAVTFFEQRLWLGGSEGMPQTIWGSKIGSHEDFGVSTPLVDDDAVEYTISSNLVNQIQWIAPGRVLLVGTSGGEFKVSGGENAITPTNVDVRRQTSHGSEHSMPEHVSNEIMFIARTGMKLRNSSYSFEADAHVSDDLTFLAEHISESGIKDLTYVQVPDSVVWAIRNDGDLVGMTYERPHQVAGWHHHSTDGDFESIATIIYNKKHQLWALVKRTVNGSTKRYVELLDPELFVDSALTYSGSSTSTLTGLSHLEGKAVSINAGGAVMPNKTVSSGSISLDWAVTSAEVGLPYTSTLTPMRMEGGNPAGTSQGAMRRWNQIFVRLDNSAYPMINGERPPVRSPGTPMTTPEPVVTDDVKVQNLGYDRDGYVTISQDLPLACHLVAIFGSMSTNA